MGAASDVACGGVTRRSVDASASLASATQAHEKSADAAFLAKASRGGHRWPAARHVPAWSPRGEVAWSAGLDYTDRASTMALRYGKPPLIEVVCELRFESSSSHPWDGVVPGLMFAALGDRYPDRREAAAMDVAPIGGVPRVRSQFFSRDGARVVQFGLDTVAVNALTPHLGWGGLRDEACAVLRDYRRVAQPARLKGAVVRYVNRVVLPASADFSLETYFNALPALPFGMSDVVTSFSVQAEARYKNPDASLRFGLRSHDANEGQLTFFVTYEHQALDSGIPEFEDLPAWLDAAHDRIELAFYGTFTGTCHTDVFQEVRDE